MQKFQYFMLEFWVEKLNYICEVRKSKGFYLVLILMLLASPKLKGEEVKKNYLALEFAGSGGLGSINLGKNLLISNNLKLNARMGLSTFQVIDFQRKFNPDIILPLEIEGVKGDQHQFKFGVGTALVSQVRAKLGGEKSRDNYFNLFAKLGYRYSLKNEPYFLELGYSPMLLENSSFRNWAFLGLGKFIGK